MAPNSSAVLAAGVPLSAFITIALSDDLVFQGSLCSSWLTCSWQTNINSESAALDFALCARAICFAVAPEDSEGDAAVTMMTYLVVNSGDELPPFALRGDAERVVLQPPAGAHHLPRAERG